MFFDSVQIISCLDSQRRTKEVLQHGGTIDTKLYDFARNISKNIPTLGQHTDLKVVLLVYHLEFNERVKMPFTV